jgi:hypothetical protein
MEGKQSIVIPEILNLILFFIPWATTSINFVRAFGSFSFGKTWERRKNLTFYYESIIYEVGTKLYIHYFRSTWTYTLSSSSMNWLLLSKVKFQGRRKITTTLHSGAMNFKKKGGLNVSRKNGVFLFKVEIVDGETTTTIDKTHGQFFVITTKKGDLYVGEQNLPQYNIIFSSSGSLLSIENDRKKFKFRGYGTLKGYINNNHKHKFNYRYGYTKIGDTIKRSNSFSSDMKDIKNDLESLTFVLASHQPLYNQVISQLKEKGYL